MVVFYSSKLFHAFGKIPYVHIWILRHLEKPEHQQCTRFIRFIMRLLTWERPWIGWMRKVWAFSPPIRNFLTLPCLFPVSYRSCVYFLTYRRTLYLCYRRGTCAVAALLAWGRHRKKWSLFCLCSHCTVAVSRANCWEVQWEEKSVETKRCDSWWRSVSGRARSSCEPSRCAGTTGPSQRRAAGADTIEPAALSLLIHDLPRTDRVLPVFPIKSTLKKPISAPQYLRWLYNNLINNQ